MVQPDLTVLAIGSESGNIEVWNIALGGDENVRATLLHSISSDSCHFYTVNKMAWRPLTAICREAGNANADVNLTLASCSDDCGVRIFNFTFSREVDVSVSG